MSTNLDALENELVRAARGKLFLDNFFADAATLGLKVDHCECVHFSATMYKLMGLNSA